MIERKVSCKCLGKTEEVEGLIFKKKVYKVALLLNNEISTTRKVPFDNYCRFEINEDYEIIMYSNNNENWYFTPEEASYNLITGGY